MSFPRTPRKLGQLAAGAALFLAVLASSALFPGRASAITIPNPIIPIKDLVGGAAGDVASKFGASALKEALEWLLGGMAKINLELIKFLVTIDLPIGATLKQATGPMIVIGGFFLIVGLTTSVGDGYREIAAGTDTAPRVIGGAIFRVIGLALLMGSWYWLVPLVVDIANGLSSYVLSDRAVSTALGKTFETGALGTPLLAAWPILGVLIGFGVAMTVLVLVVLKFVMVIAFAALYVGGPAFIGFGALPRIGPAVIGMLLRALFTLMLIPLVWTVVFVAWASVNATLLEDVPRDKIITLVMGPGLFLAGLLVLLAITKRLMSMATFGIRLGVPGAGVLRTAVTFAVLRGIGGAVGGGKGADAAGGGGAATPPPTKSASGAGAAAADAPGGGGAPSPTTAASPASAAPRRMLGGGAAPPPGQPVPAQSRPWTGDRADWEHRRAEVETAEAQEQVRDSLAVAKVRRGEFAGGDPRPADYKALADRVDERVGVWGGSPPRTLVGEAAADIPPGDQAALGGLARQVSERFADDPGRAQVEYRHAGVGQYAGRALGPTQESAARRGEALETLLAAEPSVVAGMFSAENQRYKWQSPSAPSAAGAATGLGQTSSGSPSAGEPEADLWTKEGQKRFVDEYGPGAGERQPDGGLQGIREDPRSGGS